MVPIRGKLGAIPLIQSHDEPLDLVLQVHKVLLARARRTTGLAGLIASGEAFDQESPVTMFGDALRQEARSVQ